MNHTIKNELKNKLIKYGDFESLSSVVLDTSNIFNVENIKQQSIDLIVNFGITNNIRRVNKFHECINKKINNDKIYISCAETLEERRIRVRNKSFFGFKNIIRFVDFSFKRLLPKLPVFKKIYFLMTQGRNRVMSKTEILGRLISCGFEIIEYFEFENVLYVVSKKVKSPEYNMKASYGPFFKMQRIGFKGKIISVYKMRTMYPFSEYCQELVIKENSLASSGKVREDFRVTTWGKIFRKLWIDEIPMLINFFKGELSLVGVRPLSENYFSMYPEDLQNLRINFKPGLIPPYYADLPNNFDEILNSERVYLNKKKKSPFITDLKYFFKALNNIVFKGIRSS